MILTKKQIIKKLSKFDDKEKFLVVLYDRWTHDRSLENRTTDITKGEWSSLIERVDTTPAVDSLDEQILEHYKFLDSELHGDVARQLKL